MQDRDKASARDPDAHGNTRGENYKIRLSIKVVLFSIAA